MIKPHGGTLVDRVLKGTALSAALADTRKVLPRIITDHDTLLDLENIAVGVYSPLTGFMTEDEFKSVVIKKRLADGLDWTSPKLLPITGHDATKRAKGARA